MAVLERADPRRIALCPVHSLLQRRGKEVDVLGPRRARTKRDEQTAASIDEPRQPPAERGRHDDVVEHHDRGSTKIVVREGVGLPNGRLETRRITDRQCAREVQRGAARAAAIDDHDTDRLDRRDDEVEDVIRNERIGAGTHAAAHVALCQCKRRKSDGDRAAGFHVEALRLDRPSVDLEGELPTL